jgi:hypothetical protein
MTCSDGIFGTHRPSPKAGELRMQEVADTEVGGLVAS